MSDDRRLKHFSLFPTPLGECGIAWRAEAIVATHLPEETSAATAARLVARTGASEGQPPSEIRRAIGSMTSLLEGDRIDLSWIVCDFGAVDPLSEKVYNAVRAIPPGQTLTYGAIALQLGDKRLAQNVGRILGRNPLPIIVPCHRVIGANGKLTGFSAYGGIDTKLRMLAIENARIGDAPGLFDDLPLAVKPRE